MKKVDNPSSRFRSVIENLHSKAFQLSKPINGSFEITKKCNLSCRMCYISGLETDTPRFDDFDLSPEEWYQLAIEARKHGTIFLLLTGGEVFSRHDFFEIYHPISQIGFFLTLFTNGTLVNEEIVKELKKTPPHKIEISLYGASEETYLNITQKKGIFNNVTRGIELLLKNGFSIALKTTLSKYNINDFDNMRKLAKEWKLSLSASWYLTKRRDLEDNQINDCRLNIPQCIEMHTKYNIPLDCTPSSDEAPNSRDSDRLFYCKAGRAAFTIDSSGNMMVCPSLPQPLSKPLKDGFTQAWKELNQYVDLAQDSSSKCNECCYKKYCMKCPAWSYLETGFLNQPVPYLCEIAAQRQKACEK